MFWSRRNLSIDLLSPVSCLASFLISEKTKMRAIALLYGELGDPIRRYTPVSCSSVALDVGDNAKRLHSEPSARNVRFRG